jgi:23S rRNA A2030 N6-methylase RlmJ
MSDSDQIKTDYDHSRDTYYDLIQKGQESLDLMMQFARESEHPRAFEVLSGMIKNVSDVTDRLMDLQKKTKDINKDEKEVSGTTNQNLFVGSTTDLQRLLQEQDKNELVDVTPNDESK